jgi:hypothetical protein
MRNENCRSANVSDLPVVEIGWTIVSRTRCSAFLAMPTGRANARPMTGSASSSALHRRAGAHCNVRPRISSAPRRKLRRAAQHPGHETGWLFERVVVRGLVPRIHVFGAIWQEKTGDRQDIYREHTRSLSSLRERRCARRGRAFARPVCPAMTKITELRTNLPVRANQIDGHVPDAVQRIFSGAPQSRDPCFPKS